ncbi:hypothetical protein GCM10027275_22920 [Rhabdobacter roseus]|uniref:PE-PGRS family protein n=1 Tax=Rhabdobacter roseus TaxID=1655419 RepID=A0A840TWA0_9BACT|nr:PE-PGRS family protein [Rhabdobacter roseus]MBB5284230.1 hypothetical protein [Rhabdobacter roseus]
MKCYSIRIWFTRSFLLALSLATVACWEKAPNPGGGLSDDFETTPLRAPIEPGIIDEASGLADSRTLPGYLWTHEDAGEPSRLYLLRHDGKEIRSYEPEGIHNRDWEDIEVGIGPQEGVSYIYLGDIGNNDANPATTIHYIHRIPEPTSLEGTLRGIATITYQYPDGPHDAETLLFDPQTKDLFVVSKELDKAILYRLPYPQPLDGVMTAERVGQVPSVILATGGNISTDGTEILIRTYTNMYYWRRGEGESIGQVLSRAARKSLPFELEPQGEAVCFDRESKGYFTLSERRTAASVSLNYYRRK